MANRMDTDSPRPRGGAGGRPGYDSYRPINPAPAPTKDPRQRPMSRPNSRPNSRPPPSASLPYKAPVIPTLADPSDASPISTNSALSTPVTKNAPAPAPAPNRPTQDNPPPSPRVAVSLLDVINSVIKAEKCQQEIDRLEKEIPTLERNVQKAKQSQAFSGAITLYQQQLDTANYELSKQTTMFDQHRLVSSKAEEILLSQWFQPEIKRTSEKMEKMESQIQEIKTQAMRSPSTSSISDDKMKAINYNFSKLRETDTSTTNNVTNIEGRLKTVEAALPTIQRKPEAPAGTMEIRLQRLENLTQTHSSRLGHIDVSNAKPYKDLCADVSELQDNVSRFEGNVARLQGIVSTIERNHSKLDSGLKVVDKKHQDKLSDVNIEFKKANNELSGRVFPLERAVTLLKSQPRSASSGPLSGSSEASSSFMNHRLTSLEQEVQAQGTSIQLQENKIQGIITIHRNAQDEYFAELENMNKSIESLEDGHEKTKKDAPAEYFAELEKVKNSIEMLKDDHEKTKEDVVKIDRRSESLIHKLGTIYSSIDSIRNSHTSFGDRISLLQTELNDHRSSCLGSIEALEKKLDNYRSASAGSIEGIEKNLDNYRAASAGSIEGIEQKLDNTRSQLMASVDKVRGDMTTYCNNCSATVNRFWSDLDTASKRMDSMAPALEEAKKCNELLTTHSVSLRSLEMRWSNITTGDLVKSMSDAMLEMGPLVNLNQRIQLHVTETKKRFAALTADLAQAQQASQLSPAERTALGAYPWMMDRVKALLQRDDPMHSTIATLSKLQSDLAALRQQSQLSSEDKNALAEFPKLSGILNGLSERVELMQSTFNQHTPSLQKLLQEMSHLSNKVTANEEMIYSVDAKFDDLDHPELSAELVDSVKKIDPLIATVDEHILQLEQLKNDVAEFHRAEAARSSAGLQDLTDVHTRLADLEANIPELGDIPGLLVEAESSKLRDDMLEHRLAELGSKAEGIGHQLAELAATKILTEEMRDQLDFLASKIAALENQCHTIEDEGIKLTDDQFKRLRERLTGEPIQTMLHRLRKAEDVIRDVLVNTGGNAGPQPEVRVLGGASRTNTSSQAQVTKSSVPTLGVHIPVSSPSVRKDGTRSSQLPGTPAQSTPKPGLSSGASSSSKSQASSYKKPANQQVQSLKADKRRHSIGTPLVDEITTPAPSSAGASPAPSSSSTLSKKERKETRAKRKAEREADRESKESSETKPNKKKIKSEDQS
ncbi:hypothetical protein N7508_004969 [Penicillium antarcticum]|uniref:uncharacterized protein n=1 Tax=Penicillium antarcticum TaxID=416450 RepID=UPI0023882665|nr:uncharacterized protein N7508_004969 [Penicillium antarcticum]KAJ5305954.1 hypothetical protein N7508_004969 [Penicillium antarcticum]